MSETTTTQEIQAKPEIVLLKVQLAELKNGHGLNVTYLETAPNKKPKKITLESPNYARKETVNAIRSLAHHFAVRTFYVSSADVENAKRPDRKQFERFHVHGFSLDEQGKKPYIIISGHIEEPGSSPVNTHTPITYLKKDGEKVYDLIEDLLARIETAKAEVIGYIREELVGEDPQLDMFEGDKEKVTKLQIDKPDKKTPAKKAAPGKVATKGQQAESVPAGDDRGSTVKLAHADPDAMKDVATASNAELNGKGKANKRGSVQTPDNPAGRPAGEEVQE
jgi:hypothetical protein